MAAKMWTVLPKDDADNGVRLIERTLMNEPDQEHYVVALVNRRRATLDDDTGENTPTIRVLRFEPCTGDREDRARELLRDAMDARVGQLPLPVDLGDKPSSDDDE